jgi:Holliday junction resolvase-like predicted endonuclease/bifunctional DNA-binding transcriptional regulator/antitoxin component of YhaV-PrlF toxin-antitoxin module
MDWHTPHATGNASEHMFLAMNRVINRRQQGDLGEASAIEWLTRHGATVSAPLGHSPDYDLIAENSGRLIRVQVKTSTRSEVTADGHRRWQVTLRTLGGNQSWSGVAKRFDPAKIDALFVLVGDGRRWFIPASAVEGASGMHLGGRKYSEFEVDPGGAITALVYGLTDEAQLAGSRIDGSPPGEHRSGRSGPRCKRGASLLSGFESLLPHSPPYGESVGRERRLGRAGQAIIREKRQMTLPAKPFSDAGLEIGDRLRFRADGRGRIVIERIEGIQPELALSSVRPTGESR